MFHVREFSIDGFWGDKKVHLKFHDDVNFLIGPNGSGKTTIINLLAAIFQCDLEVLQKIQFTAAQIRLGHKKARTKPTITVQKTSDADTLEHQITMRIKDGKKSHEYFFLLRPSRLRSISSKIRYESQSEPVASAIANLVKTDWLSIHRSSPISRSRDEELFESTVDKKVSEISQRFSNYFSLLDSRWTERMQQFQEFVFLSLLYGDPNHAGLSTSSAEENELKKQTLYGIFEQLKIDQNKSSSIVESHFAAVERANTHLRSRKPLKQPEFLALFCQRYIEIMMTEWITVQHDRRGIFEPKDDFLKIIDTMYTGKKLAFNERNEPVVTTNNSKKTFGPRDLSSGEKQLFILLGEVLLQERMSYVYIADEPELSLHVGWQSVLVTSMRRLNNDMQIIFATHSPDIVAEYSQNIIEVQNFIK